MTKLPKDIEKRFNEKWHKEWLYIEGIYRKRDPNKIKQFIAQELERQKKEIIAEVNLRLFSHPNTGRYVKVIDIDQKEYIERESAIKTIKDI